MVHPVAAPRITALTNAPAGTVLLHGPRSVGKRTIALDIARRLNCAGCNDDSCRSCKMAAGGNHPNILVVVPDEKGKIGVEAVHDLQHALQYQQYDPQGRRVVVLAGADTLTLPAQNALLKTLEEPPADTVVLLTAEQPQALLPTVLSRCNLVYLPPVSEKQMQQLVRGQNGAQAASILARSHGLPGLAIDFSRNPESLALADETHERVEALLAAASTFERLRAAAGLADAADRREDYVRALTERVRTGARQSARFAADLAAIDRLRRRLQANVSPKAAFEALAVELA